MRKPQTTITGTPRCSISRTICGETVEISFAAEDIAWAVRRGIEVGVDVIKVPYCGDIESYAQIVGSCPVPVVAAGGPRAGTLEDALAMAREVIAAGSPGMTVGRNIWGFPDIAGAARAFKAVIHDGARVEDAVAGVAARMR